jgi:hypothetical protein
VLTRIREWFEERRFRKICSHFGLCDVCAGSLKRGRCIGRCRKLQDGIQSGLKELMIQKIKERRGL